VNVTASRIEYHKEAITIVILSQKVFNVVDERFLAISEVLVIERSICNKRAISVGENVLKIINLLKFSVENSSF